MASIVGIGSYVPEKILCNSDLEHMVDTTDEWIVTRTGIRERRIAAPNECTSDLAHKAALKALSTSSLSPSDLDMIIMATISPDQPFPATACSVQHKLGLKGCAAVDINAACMGFIYGVGIGAGLVNGGVNKNVLVIGAEKLSSIVDWQDRNTCVLFGDGAGAVILGGEGGPRIVKTYLAADGAYTHLLNIPAGGSVNPTTEQTVKDRLHYLKMAGREVFKLAVNSMVEAVNRVIEGTTCQKSDLTYVIPHQANNRILQAVGERLSIPQDRVYVNVDKYGNTSAASTIIALDELYRDGKLKEGDFVVLVAFGGGLTWGATLIEWHA